MNLYKISQNVNNKLDTYTAAVVVAINENRAKYMHPSGFQDNYDMEDGKMKPWYLIDKPLFNDWCRPEEVEVKYLGETKVFRREGIVVANYNGILDLEQAGMMQIDVDEELIEAIDNYYFDVEDDTV